MHSIIYFIERKMGKKWLGISWYIFIFVLNHLKTTLESQENKKWICTDKFWAPKE